MPESSVRKYVMGSTEIRSLLDRHWAASNSGEVIRDKRNIVVHETQYFADPFEAPAWRVSSVETCER